jgi:uncharacterized protein involved in exopolysaccharide biosynthesis
MSDFISSNQHIAEKSNSESDIELKKVLSVLWNGKNIILIIMFAVLFIAGLIVYSLPNIYTARVLVAPAENSSDSISGLMSQYGGLASLAGVSLPTSSGDSRSQLGIELMQSRNFIRDFVERYDLLPSLMAVDSWDLTTGELIYDREDFIAETKTWVREVDPPFSAEPSGLEAHEKFLEILTITEDLQTGYVTVLIDHKSPVEAAKWAGWLIEDVNSTVKSYEVREADRAIKYLQEQIDSTALAELKVTFHNLIESQLQTKMLAEARPEFVFKVIDPAVIEEVPSSPKRIVLIIFSAIFGIVTGVIFLIARNYLKD